MQLLREFIRRILIEASYAEAIKSLETTATKIIKANNFENGIDGYENSDVTRLQNSILLAVPDDIEENQKATTVLWLLRYLKNSKPDRLEAIAGSQTWNFDASLARRAFESFFQWQRFMSVKDLNKIVSFEHLYKIVNAARADIDAYQEKKSYNNAAEGTEVILDDSEWYVAIIHNKGAACELGKGTDWCTAAPGLEYFESYYKPHDPLFFFQRKSTGEKFQFHFGTQQFMNSKDQEISDTSEMMSVLYKLDIHNRYPITSDEIITSIITQSKNPDIVSDLIDELLNALREDPSSNKIILKLNSVAENVYSTFNVLKKIYDAFDLYYSEHAYTKLLVLENPSVDPEFLRTVYKEKGKAQIVRLSLFSNPVMPRDIIYSFIDNDLSKGSNPSIQDYIAILSSQDNLHIDYLIKIANNEELINNREIQIILLNVLPAYVMSKLAKNIKTQNAKMSALTALSLPSFEELQYFLNAESLRYARPLLLKELSYILHEHVFSYSENFMQRNDNRSKNLKRFMHQHSLKNKIQLYEFLKSQFESVLNYFKVDYMTNSTLRDIHDQLKVIKNKIEKKTE